MLNYFIKSLILGALIDVVYRKVVRAMELDTLEIAVNLFDVNGRDLIPQAITDDDDRYLKMFTHLSHFLLSPIYVVYDNSDYEPPIAVLNNLSNEDKLFFRDCEINIY